MIETPGYSYIDVRKKGLIDRFRSLFLGAPAGNAIWGAVAWSLGIAALFATLSVARYKRAVVR